jgi:hypothetical protein
MGAADFVAGPHHTYDDVGPGQTDFRLKHFSIDHDRAEILPLLRQALRLNPSLKIMATPWSPPAWMKTNDSLVGGHFKDDPRVYAACAQYFVRFVQEYRRAGVPIDAVTLQNEPQNRNPSGLPGDGPARRRGGAAGRRGRARLPASRDPHQDPRLRPQLVAAPQRRRAARGRGQPRVRGVATREPGGAPLSGRQRVERHLPQPGRLGRARRGQRRLGHDDAALQRQRGRQAFAYALPAGAVATFVLPRAA